MVRAGRASPSRRRHILADSPAHEESGGSRGNGGGGGGGGGNFDEGELDDLPF
jgi:hypothetical protein